MKDNNKSCEIFIEIQKTSNFWLLKISMIFLFIMKKNVQFINYLNIFFLFMTCASLSCSTLKKMSDIFNNNNVIILFSFFQTIQIWFNNQMITISVNLFYCAFIYYDNNMSCFLIIKWNLYVMTVFIILLIIFSSVINFHELNFW